MSYKSESVKAESLHCPCAKSQSYSAVHEVCGGWVLTVNQVGKSDQLSVTDLHGVAELDVPYEYLFCLCFLYMFLPAALCEDGSPDKVIGNSALI